MAMSEVNKPELYKQYKFLRSQKETFSESTFDIT